MNLGTKALCCLNSAEILSLPIRFFSAEYRILPSRCSRRSFGPALIGFPVLIHSTQSGEAYDRTVLCAARGAAPIAHRADSSQPGLPGYRAPGPLLFPQEHPPASAECGCLRAMAYPPKDFIERGDRCA